MKPITLIAGMLIFWTAYTTATEEATPYLNANRFSEGLATVQIDGKWGFINHQGDVVIPANYTAAGGFFHGYAWVREDTKELYIDHSGQALEQRPSIPLEHYQDSTLRHFFVVDDNGKAVWGFRDQLGVVVIEPQFAAANRFHEGLGAFAVADDTIPVTRQRWGYLDAEGQVVIPASYQWTVTFSQGLAKVVHEGRVFFIDKQGAVAFPGTFAMAFDFSEGLAAIDISDRISDIVINHVRDGEWGFIDKQGQLLIPAIYQLAYPFMNGVAGVKIDQHWGVIDKSGSFVIEPDYRLISLSGSDPYIRVVDRNGKQGLFDYQGRVVIEPQYLRIGMLSEGLMAAAFETEHGRQWGYINTSGEIVIPPRFDLAREFHEGYASVTVGDESGYIDKNGDFIWEPSK